MKKISIPLFFLVFACVFNYSKVAANSKCLAYEPEIISVTGIIHPETFAGPPNYSSIEKGDEALKYWIITLDNEICVNKNTDEGNIPEYQIKVMQLVFVGSGEYDLYRSLLGKKVKIYGSLYHMYAGRHFTTVLIRVKNIELLK